MAKIVSSYVPAIGSVAAVSDPATRRVVRSVADAHNTRNGQTDQRFVTRAELNTSVADMEAATKALLDATKNATSLASIVKDGYSKGKLQQDLSNGVKGILAGVGSDYRMNIDPDLNIILMAHKDVVYLGTSLNPGPGQSAIGITANGIAMGFNDPTTGAWKDAVAIDANTGNATFLGTVNATAGNFAESITVGNTGVTLGSLVAGIYTKADLEADLSSGVGSIIAGFGGDYLMDVNTTNSTIVLTNKYAAYKAVTANPGPGRTAIGITANGIAMGYNDPISGAWQDAIAISATGDVTILGTLKAGSVIESDAVVNGRTLGDIATSTRNIHRGEWASGANYVIGDIVMHLDYGWSCIADHAASYANLPPTYPVTSNAYWTLLSVKGAQGVQGIQGPQGPRGPVGPMPDVSGLLSKTAANILTGTITPQDSGGIKVGSISWNSGTGALTGGSGVAMTEAGLIGAQNGVPKFTITSSGNATFAGDINTDGDGVFSGRNSGVTSVPIGGTNYSVDYCLRGKAETSPSWPTFVRAGVYGNSDAQRAAYNVGVMGVSSASSNGIGVLGSSPYVAGHFSSVGGIALTAISSSGVALALQGRMTINNSTLVSNLNAQYLNGHSSSSFATTSYVDSNFLKVGGTFTGRTDSDSYLKVTAGAATVYLKIYV